jgi:hypothetical protein
MKLKEEIKRLHSEERHILYSAARLVRCLNQGQRVGGTFNMHGVAQNLLHFARKTLGERNTSARLMLGID